MFTAVIERAVPSYTENFKQNGASIDIKVDYELEKGQPAIETEKNWRCIAAPSQSYNPNRFFTKVAGVSFEGRQRIVARCTVGERLVLVRDPSDLYDKGAIKVLRSNGEQLGFIPEHVSRGGDPSGLAFQMDRGDRFQCQIKDLTGGDGYKLGVNIEITEGEPDSASLEAPSFNVEPAQSNFGWFLAIATFLILIVVWIVSLR